MTTFHCPNCGKWAEVPWDVAGQMVNCPKCNQTVHVRPEAIFGGVAGAGDAPGYAGPTMPPHGMAYPAAQQFASKPGGATTVRLSMLGTPLAALGVSAAVCLLLFLLTRLPGAVSAFAAKFLLRGWTPYVCVFLTSWSFCALFGRWRKVGARRRCLVAGANPPVTSLRIDHQGDQLLRALREAAGKHRDDTVARRVEGMLKVFKNSRETEAVTASLAVEQEAAYAELDAGYSLVRAFVWTVPVLGFIGTVAGIAAGVGGFAEFVKAGAQDLDGIKTSLANVTGALAISFDTTVVALLLSALTAVFVAWVEAGEKQFLEALDSYCRNTVLPLMMSAKGPDDLVVRTLEHMHGTLMEMRKSLEELSRPAPVAPVPAPGPLGRDDETLTKPVPAGGIEDANGRKRELDDLLAVMRENLGALHDIRHVMADSPDQQVRAMQPQAEALAEVAENLKSLAGARGAFAESLPAARAEALGSALRGLQKGIEELDPFLSELAQRLRYLADPSRPLKYHVMVGNHPERGAEAGH